MQNETTKEQPLEQPMSPFCEALMDATEKLDELAQDGDTAMSICCDGKRVAIRKCGKRSDMLEVFFQLMKSDEDFRKLVLEAYAYYLHLMVQKHSHTPFKEDTPDQTATIKPLN